MSDKIPPLQLPSGWVCTTLGDVVTFEYGKGLIKEKRSNSGKIPVYGSSGIVGYHSTSLIKEKSIVVGRKGAIGSVYLVEKPSWPIDTTYFIIPSKELNINYLFYLLKTMQLSRLDKSTAIPGLNRNDAYKMTAPIAPFNEQVRIVTKVEELFSFLDAGIETLRKVQVQLKRYRKTVLKYAFEGKLTGKERSFRFDQDLNLEVPINWNMKIAKELFYIKGRIGWRGLKKAHFVPEGPYLITGVDFQNGSVDWKNCYHIPMDKYLESPEIIVQQDDVLVTKDGTIGKVACVSEIPNGKASLNAHILLIRNHEKSVIIPKYTYYMLQAPNFLNFVERRKIGTTRPALTQRAFEDFPFYYPQYKEQEEIVMRIEHFFSIADNLGQTLKQNLTRAIVLRQSILKSAFEGRLVSQDPNDEPAETLLNRIKSDITRNKKNQIENQQELSNYVK